jgi:hypothetical protein
MDRPLPGTGTVAVFLGLSIDKSRLKVSQQSDFPQQVEDLLFLCVCGIGV